GIERRSCRRQAESPGKLGAKVELYHPALWQSAGPMPGDNGTEATGLEDRHGRPKPVLAAHVKRVSEQIERGAVDIPTGRHAPTGDAHIDRSRISDPHPQVTRRCK